MSRQKSIEIAGLHGPLLAASCPSSAKIVTGKVCPTSDVRRLIKNSGAMRNRVGFAALVVILAVVILSGWIVGHDTRTAADNFASAEVESTADEPVDRSIGASAEQVNDPENRERAQEADDLLFGRVSPAEIEDAVVQRIAEQSGLKLTSLNAVDCDLRTCRVVFSGVNANPQYTDEYSDLLSALTNPPWKDYQPTSGSIGTREISPGTREYEMGFTYVALVDTSEDPEIAARQHAACAGAWARVTQQRGSDDYIRGGHGIA